MKAIQYQAYGGYQENRLVDLPAPQPEDGEVLVEMRSVGINPLDNTFRGGTLVVVGYAGGRQAEVDITDIIWKAATIRGFTFRLFEPEKIRAARAALLDYLREGALKPTIGRVFPLADAAEAVRYLIEDRPFGRVLMKLG